MDNLLASLAFRWAVPGAHADYYTPVYVLAFGLNLLLLLREGWRRGYPMRSWLVVLVCSSLAFILGTKLLALSGPEWQLLLSTGHWPISGGRSVLGGAVSGTLMLLALRRPLGFSWHMFDAFALPMCLALTIQCVGCVLTGCCFGEPTAGGWGLTYGPGTWPYVAQVTQGVIGAGAARSLPVHPTQLYTLLLCAGVGALLMCTRHKPWPGGSRNLLHLGLLLAGRWLIEFWRDAAGEPVGATVHEHGGLTMNELQWVLLVLVPVLLGLWAWQLRRQPATGHPQYEKLPTVRPALNLLAVAGLLLVTGWLGSSALSLPEILVMKALLLCVLVLEAGAALRGSARQLQPARLALPLCLVAGVVVLTSQVPVDSVGAAESYSTISGGFSTGSFQRQQNTSGGCGGDSQLQEYRHRYTTGTLDYTHTRLPGTDVKGRVHKAEVTWGIRLHAGVDHQQPTSDSLIYQLDYRPDNLLISFNPYAQLDRKWLGVGVGVMAGNLGFHRIYYGDEQSVLDGQASLRVGPRPQLFAIADYNYLGYGTANPQHRLGLGTGFGGTRWQVIGGAARARDYDIAEGQSRWSGFLEARGNLTPQWQASSFVTLGNPNQQQIGLRFGYRLPNKSTRR
ncbi:prolipoprotein diacylglyceryl transferase family protein [Hymenobacter endophyticus]|uniref:Prolipoprotein diacylglyceryl transferase n=1 Tax=Hymenobacter endophyticus TaxID=3076335 RepID=A0ABU3TJD7_9BACT|nr:prolipoprotein diacylglyceryl transferase family protein [Hymenobacter endophyticus]MDU0371494.1 prolipoprotein diacylglyceryl transferase [Hymenobacter endophyticus]